MNEAPKRQVSIVVAMLTYFGMLFGTLLLMIGLKGMTDPTVWYFIICISPVFPCGLGLLCGPGSGLFGIALMVISYISFIVFFVLFARVRTWGTYGMLCFGFAILLLMNVAGCREGFKSFGSSVTMMSAPALGVKSEAIFRPHSG
jgi:hypothetical protein